MRHPPTGSEKSQHPLWEVLIRSWAVTFPPSEMKTLVWALLANAVWSSAFVSLLNNVIGYNWGNYELLEEAKHRCLSPGLGYSSPKQRALNSPLSRIILPYFPEFKGRWGREGDG